MLTEFKPTGKNRWAIRVKGSKKGRIEKRRGSFVAVITRYEGLPLLESACAFLQTLNSGRSGLVR
jgi:hypothetical protein